MGRRKPGVYKASTVYFANVAAMRARDWKHKLGYTYGLHGTPTTFMLEERIAALEGGKHCILVPSGLAAIANVGMALLKSGDEVLIPDNAYGPTKAFAEGELKNWGISHQLYDAMNPADLQARIGPQTKLVWLEAPGSVTMEFVPLAHLAHICRERGVTTALDNTWAGGLAFNGFDLGHGERRVAGSGADVVVHALTKYPSGGGDVLMGAMVTRDDELHQRLKLTHMRVGWGVGGNDAEADPALVAQPAAAVSRPRCRSARSWRPGCSAARKSRSCFIRPSKARQAMSTGARSVAATTAWPPGLFSVVFDERYSTAQVDAFCDALEAVQARLFLGRPGEPGGALQHRVHAQRAAGSWTHKGILVRFSVGLEAVEDLRADLEQALAALA